MTNWKEQLQSEIIGHSVFLAEMRVHAKDGTTHRVEMREQWEKLCLFIESLLAEQKKEVVDSQVDKIKHKYNGFGGVLGFTRTDLINLLKHHE